jgi:putative RNA 2'-phosphotransferase
VLRHHPEEIGLELDAEGQANIETLTAALRARRGLEKVTRRDIESLTTGPSASRFEVRGDFIRARYGHSLAQLIRYEAATPPKHLFHGTPPEAAARILAEGLKARGRQRVHLSIDVPEAREVGRRRSENTVILRVDTLAAAKAGVKFYRGGPAVWLSDDIPPRFLARLP